MIVDVFRFRESELFKNLLLLLKFGFKFYIIQKFTLHLRFLKFPAELASNRAAINIAYPAAIHAQMLSINDTSNIFCI